MALGQSTEADALGTVAVAEGRTSVGAESRKQMLISK